MHVPMVIVQKANDVYREDTKYFSDLGKRCNYLKEVAQLEQLQCMNLYTCTPHGMISPVNALAMPEHQSTHASSLANNHRDTKQCDIRCTKPTVLIWLSCA